MRAESEEAGATRDRINAMVDRRIDEAEGEAALRMVLIAAAMGAGLLAGWGLNIGFTALNAARIAGGW